MKLVEIRRNTFTNAANRAASEYVDWKDQEKEHQTKFYPNWPIFRYPKKYDVRNVTDWDFCDKNFNNKKRFLIWDFFCRMWMCPQCDIRF